MTVKFEPHHRFAHILVATGILAWMPIACRSNKPAPTSVIVNDVRIDVQVARTEHEWRRGLSGRHSLPDNWGMLFVAAKSRNMIFYMKDCYVDIDIAFIDETGHIVNLDTMVVEDDPVNPLGRYRSDRPARYVLETAGAPSSESAPSQA